MYRGSGSYHQSSSEKLSFFDFILIVFGAGLLICYLLSLLLRDDDSSTNPQSILKACKHAPSMAESSHEPSKILALTQKFEGRVAAKIKKLNKKYQASYSLASMKNDIKGLFLAVQEAWSKKDRACINSICLRQYRDKLYKQMTVLERNLIVNTIKDIEISECSLISLLLNHGDKKSILTAVLRGTLIDEYYIENYENQKTASHTPRNFNCLMTLSISKDKIWITDIDLINHPDDVIVRLSEDSQYFIRYEQKT